MKINLSVISLLQVGLYLGPYPAVVLYDYEDARDLFNQDVVSGIRNLY